ncbi:MAG TPA: GGDEF domain-containing protein [Terriglobales bacterium]|nr:GGDEF domain-containing protein [Terriglobales bacterium]
MQTGKLFPIEEEQAATPSMLERAEQIQREIQQLSGRDLQLWSIGILVMLVLAAGMLALIFPNILWAQRVIHVESAYLPQLFFGLISLVLLFNIYLIGQKISLNNTRRALISELVLNERLESLSLVDPLTESLNRRALNELIPREVARANRLGSHLTFMTLDISGFREINSKFGALEGNMLLRDFAKMMKATFRGGDMIFRQGGDEFLVVMPDTAEEEAQPPLRRLLRAVEHWNASGGKRYELSFVWAVAPYVTGSDVADVLRTVDRKMYQKKHNLVPVF